LRLSTQAPSSRLVGGGFAARGLQAGGFRQGDPAVYAAAAAGLRAGGDQAPVLEEYAARKHLNLPLDAFLLRKSGHTFYNTSPLDFAKLLADPDNIKANLTGYVAGFSESQAALE
jgi:hypothetical protein